MNRVSNRIKEVEGSLHAKGCVIYARHDELEWAMYGGRMRIMLEMRPLGDCSFSERVLHLHSLEGLIRAAHSQMQNMFEDLGLK